MIPTFEERIDELLLQYDEALDDNRHERARQLAIEIETLVEQIKGDVVAVRTIH